MLRRPSWAAAPVLDVNMSVLSRLKVLAFSPHAAHRACFCRELSYRTSALAATVVRDFLKIYVGLLSDSDLSVRIASYESASTLALSLIHSDPELGYETVFQHELLPALIGRLSLEKQASGQKSLVCLLIELSGHIQSSQRASLLLNHLVPILHSSNGDSDRVMALNVLTGVLPLLPAPTPFVFILPLLVSLLTDSDPNLRAGLPECLKAIAGLLTAEQVSAKIIPCFLTLLKDTHAFVRKAAVSLVHIIMKNQPIERTAGLISSIVDLLHDPVISVAKASVLHSGLCCSTMSLSSQLNEPLLTEFVSYLKFITHQSQNDSSLLPLAEALPKLIHLIDRSLLISVLPVLLKNSDLSIRVHAANLLVALLRRGESIEEEVFVILDHQLKSADYEILRIIQFAKLDQIFCRLTTHQLMRVFFRISLTPKRSNWRKRLLLIDNSSNFGLIAMCNSHSMDLLRFAVLPLWLRLLSDVSAQVRDETAFASGFIFRLIFDVFQELARPFIAHTKQVFLYSESFQKRKTFIKFAASVIRQNSEISQLLIEDLVTLRNDPVYDVRLAYENAFGNCLNINVLVESCIPDKQVKRARSVSDVGWMFAPSETDELVSELSENEGQDEVHSPTRSPPPPEIVGEEGEAVVLENFT